jgi:hypothetical protein
MEYLKILLTVINSQNLVIAVMIALMGFLIIYQTLTYVLTLVVKNNYSVSRKNAMIKFKKVITIISWIFCVIIFLIVLGVI